VAKQPKEDKETKIIRSVYYLQQLVPIISYSLVAATIMVARVYAFEEFPEISKSQLQTYKSTMSQNESTVESLNTSKRSYLEKKANLETTITEIKNQRDAEGSSRFYTQNIPAYCRYVEFRANDYNVEVISVDIKESENTVDFMVMGDYPNLTNFFNSLETREIYYLENFELFPSATNSGSYVSFTSNFNLDATIAQRYEKKRTYVAPVKVVEDTTVNEIPVETIDDSAMYEETSTVTIDYMNTGKEKPETTTEETTESMVVVEPIS
jgi:hypothetical protein